MNYIDLTYCGYISSRLEGYVLKTNSPFSANFRCPFCGDSQKSKFKKRGWLLEKNGKIIFYCHNCNESKPSLLSFLKSLDHQLYSDYIFALKADHMSSGLVQPPAPELKVQKYTANLKGVIKVSSLPTTHPVKKYLDKRMIPSDKHYKLYYSPKFKHWINSIIPDKFKMINEDGTDIPDEPRLVIPFIDEKGKIFGLSARSFKPDGLRYITIMFDESKPKLFGLDTLDYTKSFNVVEGPIDSLFLDNTIAMAGTDIRIDKIPQLSNATFILDNEPRNVEVCKKIENLIDKNCKIVIWPSDIKEKDINLMILAGKTKQQLQEIIKQRTFSGLSAKLEFQQWRK